MQSEAPRELEAKFALSKQEELDALANSPDLPNGFSIGGSQVVSVSDAYLDTRDMLLLRHGYTVRLRTKGDNRLITLKSLEEMHGGHIQDRMEIEKPLDPGSEEVGLLGWHEEIRRIVYDVAGEDAHLQPVCIVVQTRHKEWLHTDPSDSPMAELSLDQVAVSAGEIGDDGSGESRATGPSSRFFEVELELLDPSQEPAFFALVQWLESRSELSPAKSSKLVSGLRAIAAQPLDTPVDGSADARSGIQPEMQMTDACRLIWRQQMTEMNLNESGVRSDQGIEYVHDMRVATRRARAASLLFGRDFKQKKVQNHLKFFKRAARKLGAVRDLDVALAKLHDYVGSLPYKKRKTLKTVAWYWRQERRARLNDLLDLLESDAYARALVELDIFCRTPGAGARRQKRSAGKPPALVQVRHVLPSQILTRFEAVRRYEIVFAQVKSVPLATLHALRIDCKYLRYVLEFSEHLLGTEGATLIAHLKDLQDVLGDLNDADVALGMLRGLRNEVDDGDALSAYMDHQKATIEALRRQMPDAFTAFAAAENRLLLATALARL